MESKFKIGDIVNTLNVFTGKVSYAGFGYEKNLKGLEITHIQKAHFGIVYYFKGRPYGIYEHAIIDPIKNREDKFKNLLDGTKI